MNLTEEDIDKILKIVEESKFDSLHLEYGDLKLTVGKGGKPIRNAVPPTSAPSSQTLAPSPPSMPDKVEPKVVEQGQVQPNVSSPETSATQSEEEENLLPVTAPMVGTFYCSPEPGAEPFVGAGSHVDEDTVVGLIEVMKVFTSVRAGARGEIVRGLVEDAQFVEYGQPLFLVRPDNGKDE